jgi:hypothetical protein
MLHHNCINFQLQNGYDVCQELSEYEISTKRLASIPDIGKLASISDLAKYNVETEN